MHFVKGSSDGFCHGHVKHQIINRGLCPYFIYLVTAIYPQGFLFLVASCYSVVFTEE